MGGLHGYARGNTKIECYLNFRKLVNRRQIEEETDLSMDGGAGTKPELYRTMNKDPKTGEWVFYYHFGK